MGTATLPMPPSGPRGVPQQQRHQTGPNLMASFTLNRRNPETGETNSIITIPASPWPFTAHQSSSFSALLCPRRAVLPQTSIAQPCRCPALRSVASPAPAPLTPLCVCRHRPALHARLGVWFGREVFPPVDCCWRVLIGNEAPHSKMEVNRKTDG